MSNNLFNFDENFDPQAVDARRALEKEALGAGMSADEARAYARQGGGHITMGHSDEEVETLKQQAYQQGLADGNQQGLQEGLNNGVQQGMDQVRNDAQVLASQALQSFGQHMSELHAGYQQELQRLRAEAISIGVHIARRLAPGLIEQNPAPEIESMIHQVLEDIGEKPQVSIKVAPPVAPIIEEKIQAIKFETRFEGEVEVVGDPTIPATDCRLDWSKGGAERSFSRMLIEVEKAVARYLGHDLPDADSALIAAEDELQAEVEQLRTEIAELEQKKAELEAVPDPEPVAAPAEGTSFDEAELTAPVEDLPADESEGTAAPEEEAAEDATDQPAPMAASFGDDMATFDVFTPGDIENVDADPEAAGKGMDFKDITLSKAKADPASAENAPAAAEPAAESAPDEDAG